ncbi:hypothetical protein HAX54_033232, partial [Datura stramonium]|nr:hypothetical protein [Datura stramonium]
MKCRFGKILASGQCLDVASHRRFMDHNRWFTNLSPIENLPPQFSAYHWRFFGDPWITSYGFAGISL